MKHLSKRWRASRGNLKGQEWFLANTERKLPVTGGGVSPAPQGQIADLTPLTYCQAPSDIAVPKTGDRSFTFLEVVHGRKSKLALVSLDAPVVVGADIDTCSVSAGMAGIWGPQTDEAADAFRKTLTNGADPYDDFFAAHDMPQGRARKIVSPPDRTPVPYIQSGWGDGSYPVFTLHDKKDTVCAISVDFMGRDGFGTFQALTGVSLE